MSFDEAATKFNNLSSAGKNLVGFVSFIVIITASILGSYYTLSSTATEAIQVTRKLDSKIDDLIKGLGSRFKNLTERDATKELSRKIDALSQQVTDIKVQIASTTTDVSHLKSYHRRRWVNPYSEQQEQ